MYSSLGSYNLFNQQYLASEIISGLSRVPPINIVAIKGPSGSGKTYLLNEISQLWVSYDDKNFVLNLTCEAELKERNYSTFTRAVLQATRNLFTEKMVVKGVSELTKGIPYAGDFIGFLVKSFGDLDDLKQAHETRYLNDVEKMLVYDLSNLARGKNLMIVIDNLQWLDESSLGFIKLLTDDAFLTAVPSLRNLKFVCVLDTDIEPQCFPIINQHLNGESVMEAQLSYVSSDRYLDALKKFGFKGRLKPEVLNTLYSLTSGHLMLIKRLAEYLCDKELNSAEIQEDDFWNNPDANRSSLIESLISFKLKELGANGQLITETLEYASVIGFSFSFDELSCISRENDRNLREIIQKAQEAQLAEQGTNANSFSHDIIREFFLSKLSSRRSKYYGLFANCLSILRPSDYSTRGEYLFEAGKTEECLTVYIHEVLKNSREGIRTSPVVDQRIKSLIRSKEIQDYYDSMILANKNFNLGLYEEARKNIEGLEDYLPKTLVAEKYYLLALCLLKSMTQEDMEQARESLLDWDDLEPTESEIWLRLMSTLMTIQGNLGDFNAAQHLVRKMMIHLDKRKAFDKSAEYNLNVIRRKASSLSTNEVSCERTSKSLEFFSVMDNSESLIYPVQYYYSLTNHAANLMIRGDFKEAAVLSGLAIDLLNKYSYINFLEPQIPASNYIISGYLSSLVSATDAMTLFNKIKPYTSRVADNLLVKNNYFVTMIEAGQIENAHQGFDSLNASMEHEQIDEYYRYFIKSNLALIKYVLGNVDWARQMWTRLETEIPNIPDKVFLIRRHKILQEFLGIAESGNPNVFSQYISEKYPSELGRPWKFYGRGFLFSDIQLWYES